MRLLSWSSSSPPIRFLVAAISDSNAYMASRPQYRGGRYHMNRGYCDRSAFGKGDNVAESSQQGRGRDWNTGFRQVDGSGYVDNRSYNNVSWRGQLSPRPQFQQNRPPYYHQNQNFNGKPGFIYNAPMNTPPGPILDSSYVSHGQPMYVNQQRGQPNQSRPRNSKPLDFREWEYAKPEPPRHWERFTILSYNILADYLANDHWRKLYFHIPRHMLSWEWRKMNLFFELRLWSPDIMCFQEVDRFQELAVELKRQGYDGIYKMRTGNPVDGCSIFWRTSKFKLLHEESIEFNKLGLRDNVAQICVLESVQRIQMENLSVSDTSSAGSNRVVVCNIHVLFNPKRGDIKIGQVRVLFEKAHAVSKAWNNAPIVVCGDFNCTPKSPLYNYIVEQKLELSELARDKVSGQTSAEIQAPIFYSPNLGQVPMNIEPSTRYVGLNSDAEKSDSQLDSQKQITNSEPADNLPSQPQHVLADEPNGTVTSEGDLNSVDVDDVLNEPKNTPPLSPGPNFASLKSNTIETENSTDHSIPHAESLDEISSPEPSSGGTMHTENNIHQRGEETGHATETSHISHSAPLEASSSFETIYDDPAKSLGENEDIGEDGETFLSELTRDSLNLDYNQPQTTHPVEEQEKHNLSPESEPFSPGRTAYNLSLWTPTEIETATGNADCTSLEHPLKLSSTYSETEDLLGTRDANGEPLITSYHRCFCGTVDYIWRSEGFRTVRVLSPMRKQAMQWTAGFPTKKWGSDHIALVAHLAFVEEAPEQGDKRDQ